MIKAVLFREMIYFILKKNKRDANMQHYYSFNIGFNIVKCLIVKAEYMGYEHSEPDEYNH